MEGGREPTVGPRPATVTREGFFAWWLRLNYALDWRYNCFSSLHVAHAFVSALTSYRVHRRVGFVAVLWAALVALRPSTQSSITRLT
jgi:hypothetical protein